MASFTCTTDSVSNLSSFTVLNANIKGVVQVTLFGNTTGSYLVTNCVDAAAAATAAGAVGTRSLLAAAIAPMTVFLDPSTTWVRSTTTTAGTLSSIIQT